MPERIVLVGYGPVGARFVEELLPAVREGLVELTVVGAEPDEAYNRVLVGEFALGRAERSALELTDAAQARAAGVRLLLDTCVTELRRSRRRVLLGTGDELEYDRLVLATGARAQTPTLDGLVRVRRDHSRPPAEAAQLDRSETPLPAGVTVLRDLADARSVRAAIDAGSRLVVLGAGVLGMEFALAAAEAGAHVTVVYHDAVPMERNLDRGAGTVLARRAAAAGVAMVAHARAESLVFQHDEGEARFESLVTADGKEIPGELLVLSCGVAPRTELARIAGLPVARGVLVDAELRSWGDPRILAIGDCSEPADPSEGHPTGSGPAGLIGIGWRQAEWLARRLRAELAGLDTPALPEAAPGVVMLKADGIDLVAAGEVHAELWDSAEHGVTVWADPEHGAYVKLVSRDGVLAGFVSLGMPRTGAELTLLYERGSELPADRSLLLRLDAAGAPITAADPLEPSATVCWCNGVTAGRISEAIAEGADSVACVGRDTRAGTGCGGCKGRISELLARAGLGAAGAVLGTAAS